MRTLCVSVCLCLHVSPSDLFVCFSPAVRFVDCGRGDLVRFECSNPSHFRIEADGVVYAASTVRRSALDASPLLITASDAATQQQWEAHVLLAPSSQQVNTAQPPPRHLRPVC